MKRHFSVAPVVAFRFCLWRPWKQFRFCLWRPWKQFLKRRLIKFRCINRVCLRIVSQILRQFGKEVIKVVIRIQVVQLRCLGKAVNDCACLCPLDGIDENPVLLSDAKSANTPFRSLCECSDKLRSAASNRWRCPGATRSSPVP